MSWRCEYNPAVGDVVCIIPSDLGGRQPYDHLELKPGVVTNIYRVGEYSEMKLSVLIDGSLVEVWYPDLFHIR